MTWQTKKLGSLGEFIKGSGVSKNEVVDSGLPAVRYGEIYTRFNTKILVLYSFINKDTALRATEITKGDILFAGSGETIDDIGKSVVYHIDNVGYAGGDIIILRPDKNINSLFLSYALKLSHSKKQTRMFGQGNSVVHIYASDLKKLEVLIPDLAEQERIVGVLEVWDDYLEKLERKIQLKEQSKLFLSYAIFNQEISEDITQMKIKDLCIIRTGKKDVNQGNPDGVYPFFTCSREHTYSDDFSYDCEATLVAGNADVGHCKYYRGKFEAYQRTYILSDFKNIDVHSQLQKRHIPAKVLMLNAVK